MTPRHRGRVFVYSLLYILTFSTTALAEMGMGMGMGMRMGGGETCRYENGNENIMICGSGRYHRGGDGVFRQSGGPSEPGGGFESPGDDSEDLGTGRMGGMGGGMGGGRGSDDNGGLNIPGIDDVSPDATDPEPTPGHMGRMGGMGSRRPAAPPRRPAAIPRAPTLPLAPRTPADDLITIEGLGLPGTGGASPQPASPVLPPDSSSLGLEGLLGYGNGNGNGGVAPSVPPSHGSQVSGDEAIGIVQNRCTVCHTGQSGPGMGPRFPEFVKNWGQWKGLLDQRNPQAVRWLTAFQNMVGNSDAMLNLAHAKAAEKGQPFAEHEQQSLRNFIRGEYGSLTGAGTNNLGKQRDFAPIIMTGKGREQIYDSALKKMQVLDPRVAELFSNYDIMYDHTGLPRAHQMPNVGNISTGAIGLRQIGHETFGPPIGHILDQQGKWMAPFANGVGIGNDTKGNGTFFLVKLPRDASGKRIPIASWNERLHNHYLGRGDENLTNRLSYPVGTQFAEVRFTNVGGKMFIHTVLTRTKKAQGNGAFWDPDVLSAYPSAELFAERIEAEPNWQSDPTLRKWHQQARAGGTPDRIVSSFPGLFKKGNQRTSQMIGRKIELGQVDDDKFARLFENAPLRSGKGSAVGFGLSGGGVYPQNYHVGAVAVNGPNCTNCHNMFGKPARELVSSTASLAATSAYGNMGAGGDGIGSFYILDPGRLREFQRVRDNRSYNPALMSAGLIRSTGTRPSDPRYRLTN